MSPRKITRLALLVGGISIIGTIVMAVAQPQWGWLTWWPALGLGLAVLLLVVSFLRGGLSDRPETGADGRYAE